MRIIAYRIMIDNGRRWGEDMLAMKKIIVATIKSWNIKACEDLKKKFEDSHEVILIKEKDKLTCKKIKHVNPDWIFFPHWSWIIPSEIFNKFKCVAFHMTDLPYGRGGSPLQNLIVNKIYKTKISAIEVDEGIDTGKIYMKKNLNIKDGRAEEIYERMAKIIFEQMIPEMLNKNIKPKKQKGGIVKFRRRKPEDSDMLKAKIKTTEDAYDFIRMLDAEGYPKAFIKKGKLEIELSNVKRIKNKLHGNFTITEK